MTNLVSFFRNRNKDQNVGVSFFKKELRDDETKVDKYQFLIDEIIKTESPISSSIKSYNHWIKHLLPLQIKTREREYENGILKVVYENFKFQKPRLGDKILLPRDARRLGVPYFGKVLVDCYLVRGSEKILLQEEVTYSEVPVMLGSIACHTHGLSRKELLAISEDPTDPFGYFIFKSEANGEVYGSNVDYVTGGEVFVNSMRKIKKDDRRTGKYTTELKIIKPTGSEYIVITFNESETVPIIILNVKLKGYDSKDIEDNNYLVFDILDILLQIGYEDLRYEYGKDVVSDLELIEGKEKVLTRILELLKRFIGEENWEKVKTVLIKSVDDYKKEVERNSKKLYRKIERLRRFKDEVIEETLETYKREGMKGIKLQQDFSSEESTINQLTSQIFSQTNDKLKAECVARMLSVHILTELEIIEPTNINSWGSKMVYTQTNRVMTFVNRKMKPLVPIKTFEGLSQKELIEGDILNIARRVRIEDYKSDYMYNGAKDEFNAQNKDGDPKKAVRFLERENVVKIYSQLSEITASGRTTSKRAADASARKIQNSQTGYVCLYETPQSDAIGITKYLGCTTSFSFPRNSEKYIKTIIEPTLKKYKLNFGMNFGDFTSDIKILVILDARIGGWIPYNEKLIDELQKNTKRSDEFFDVEIIFKHEQTTLSIKTSGWLLKRPFFTTENGKINISKRKEKMSLMEYVRLGDVEFLTPEEFSRITVGMDEAHLLSLFEKRQRCGLAGYVNLKGPGISLSDVKKYRIPLYCEITGLAILGFAAALSPWQNMCQAARVTYQSKMAGQAIGNGHMCLDDVSFTTLNVCKTSRSIVETSLADILGLNQSPNGKMVLVGMMILTNDCEDGVVFQSESADNMYNKHIKTKNFKDILEYQGVGSLGVYEMLHPPPTRKEFQKEKFHAIGEDGLPIIGKVIKYGDVIISTVRLDRSGSKELDWSGSQKAEIGDEGVIDSIDIIRGGSGGVVTVKVKIRQMRPILIGDKVASRYSQKGTFGSCRSSTGCSLTTPRMNKEGMFYGGISEEEIHPLIPFGSELPVVKKGPFAGCTPEFFVNPLGQPTRMTPSMMFEMLISKAAVFTGDIVNGTTFKPPSHEDLTGWMDVLESYGMNRDGEEEMVYQNGRKLGSGVKIFVAPCYYQTLKHFVLDKIQYRGALNEKRIDSGQVERGKNVKGGIKIGTMERNALCSYGASSMVLNMLMKMADEYTMEICVNCGNQIIIEYMTGNRRCPVCPIDKISPGLVRIPYGTIYLNRFLNAAGIETRFTSLKKVDRYELE